MPPKKKYKYGAAQSDWTKACDFYVTDGWNCIYTDDGTSQSGNFYIKKEHRTSEEFKSNPDEAIQVMIAGHQAERKRKAEQGEGPASKKGKRVAATEAATVVAAEGHTATSEKRPVAAVDRMNLDGIHRDYEHERERRRKNAQPKQKFQQMMEGLGDLRSAIRDELERGIDPMDELDGMGELDKAQEELEAANLLQPTSYSSSAAPSIGGSAM